MASHDDVREAGIVGRVRALARVDDERASSPGGTDLLSFAQVAKLIGERIGKPLRHETIPKRDASDAPS